MKNTLALTFLFTVNVLMLPSCSNKLTREKAADLIKEQGVDKEVTYDTWIFNKIGAKDISAYQKLANEGLITITQSRYWLDAPTYDIAFTEKGNRYFIEKHENIYLVLGGLYNFKEITGITFSDENIAKVEFTLSKTNITPFGILNGDKDGDVINGERQMKKYDDGWRIDGEKIKVRHAKDCPGIFETK